MKPAPLMFAAIVLAIFAVFLLALLFWLGYFPGPHVTSTPGSTP